MAGNTDYADVEYTNEEFRCGDGACMEPIPPGQTECPKGPHPKPETCRDCGSFFVRGYCPNCSLH